MSNVNARGRRSGVQSVFRALDLLDTLEREGGTLGISELADLVGLPAGTVHRLATTLVDSGYLRHLSDRRYCLGSRLASLGASATALMGTQAQPVLRDLAGALGETANLAVFSSGDAEYVGQVAGSHSMRMFTEVGRRVPVHSTGVGKALLSMLADHEALRVLRREGMPSFTSSTITTPEAHGQGVGPYPRTGVRGRRRRNGSRRPVCRGAVSRRFTDGGFGFWPLTSHDPRSCYTRCRRSEARGGAALRVTG